MPIPVWLFKYGPIIQIQIYLGLWGRSQPYKKKSQETSPSPLRANMEKGGFLGRIQQNDRYMLPQHPEKAAIHHFIVKIVVPIEVNQAAQSRKARLLINQAKQLRVIRIEHLYIGKRRSFPLKIAKNQHDIILRWRLEHHCPKQW